MSLAMRAAFALVLIACGCGDDPSLAVEVEHPNATRIGDALRDTTVSIYESDGLTCDQVEFGDLTTDQLDALLSAKVTIAKGGATTGTFAGVSRVAHKVIVARGLGDQGELITARCAELDEVGASGGGVDTVKLETVVAAKVSIASAEDGAKGILVTTTEPLPGSKSLNGREVSWRLFGPSGTTADSAKLTNLSSGVWEPISPTCTTGGEATIHPVAPKVPGGYALRLRVSWATEPPPLITQFTDIPHAIQNLAATPASVVRPCAVRRSGGTAGVVCITGPTLATEFRLAGASLVATSSVALTANADPPIGVVSVELHDAADTRDVYAITERGNWQALFGAPPVTGSPDRDWWCGALPCGTTSTYDLQIVPACGNAPGFLVGKVGLSPTMTSLRKMPLRGGPIDVIALAGEAIANAGCLTERQPDGNAKPRQAIVVSGPGGAAQGAPAAVIFECSATRNPCVIPQATDGVGFAHEVPPRMIVSTFDASGTVLSSVDGRPNEVPDGNGTTRDRLIELSRQPAAAPPEQLITGNFDDDHQLDLVWHFATRLTGSNVQIAYAREVDGTPITALAGFGGQPIEELLSGDLDGNGIDEVIAVLGPAARKLDVIPMGLPYPPSAPHDDPPCP